MDEQRLLQSLVGPLMGKWKAELAMNLKDGPMRMSEIEKRIPRANPKVLKQQLQGLESDGIVEKKTYDESVEYSLTEHGKALLPLLEVADLTIKEYSVIGDKA